MGTYIKNPKKSLCINFISNSEKGKLQCYNCKNFNKDKNECSFDNAPFILTKSNFIQIPEKYTCSGFEKIKNVDNSSSIISCINCKHFSSGGNNKILPYCFNPKGKPEKIEWKHIDDPENMICPSFAVNPDNTSKNNCCARCIHYHKEGCDLKDGEKPEYLMESVKKVKITSPPDRTFCKSFIPKNDTLLKKSRCSECFYFNSEAKVCEDNRTTMGVARNKLESFMEVADVCPVHEAKHFVCNDFQFNRRCRTFCKDSCCFNCINYIKDSRAKKFSACTKQGINSPTYRKIRNGNIKTPNYNIRILYKIKSKTPVISVNKTKNND